MRVISGLAKGTLLHSLEGNNTRPTLDRVKEALFNILQNNIRDAKVLDLFSGSGALAIESLSRGAEYAVLNDRSIEATKIIQRNLEKTHLTEKANVLTKDYKKTIQDLKGNKFDIIFIDPPYAQNIAVDAVKMIIQADLLSNDGIIIIETDDETREIKELENISINIYDLREYGRVKLIFLNLKE